MYTAFYWRNMLKKRDIIALVVDLDFFGTENFGWFATLSFRPYASSTSKGESGARLGRAGTREHGARGVCCPLQLERPLFFLWSNVVFIT